MGGIVLQTRTIHEAEQDRPDVAQQREVWKDQRPELDAGRLTFIDETLCVGRAKTSMTRLRTRAPIGEPLIEKSPHGHWMITSLIAALGISVMRCATVVDRATNCDAFVEQVPVAELKPGDVVILDNLPSHKSERARRFIEMCWARLAFLPPYNPDLNPIEIVFSKVKPLLRSLGCRTRDALWHAMQSVLDEVTATDAANCFLHCGCTSCQN
jgi:hypothetical protein